MNLLQRALLKSLLLSAAREHRRADRPLLAGYAFDQITLKMHLDGRFADGELRALEEQLFPRLPQGGICLDIGANIGNHAVAFAAAFAHVHAFEPNPKALDLLRINAALRDNISVHATGLSDAPQTVEVIQPAGNLGGTGMTAAFKDARDGATGQRVELSLERLDDLALGGPEGPLTFVKIDVEGHEEEVLAGAAETLSRDFPVLALEIDRRSVRDGTTPAVETARRLGYRHMAGLGRGPRPRFTPVERLAARNYPLLLLSTGPLDLS